MLWHTEYESTFKFDEIIQKKKQYKAKLKTNKIKKTM
jgi:hypothetical protein